MVKRPALRVRRGTVFLSLDNLVTAAERLVTAADRLVGPHAIADVGSLESAVARHQAAVYGQDVYPNLDANAAALLLSVASALKA